MTPGDDEALLVRAVAGDRDALSALLTHVGPQVREAIAAGLSRKWQSVLDADDVMQVSYIEAFLRIGTFVPSGMSAFTAWLRRIAENNLRDAIRGLRADKRPPPGRRVQAAESDSSADGSIAAIDGTGATPSREAAGAEAQLIIEEALRGLPPDYAAVVRGYDLQGRTAQEVADEIGRSTGAVYMLRARALAVLRERLPTATAFFTRAG